MLVGSPRAGRDVGSCIVRGMGGCLDGMMVF